jgi:hypothetical protein
MDSRKGHKLNRFGENFIFKGTSKDTNTAHLNTKSPYTVQSWWSAVCMKHKIASD